MKACKHLQSRTIEFECWKQEHQVCMASKRLSVLQVAFNAMGKGDDSEYHGEAGWELMKPLRWLPWRNLTIFKKSFTPWQVRKIPAKLNIFSQSIPNCYHMALPGRCAWYWLVGPTRCSWIRSAMSGRTSTSHESQDSSTEQPSCQMRLIFLKLSPHLQPNQPARQVMTSTN